MKTLTTANWVLIGLYGVLILYLIVANNSPDNDAAGRGMMGGLIVILLVFVGGLTYLNLGTSRTAKITASVLGAVPLLLVRANLAAEAAATRREKAESISTTIPDASETKAATQTVVDFLHWYKANLIPISKIILVNQQPGKPYSVNMKNTERYLTYLKSSGMLTDQYLAEWRTFFKDRQAGFQLTHQHEGPPTGFEYDLVMLTQEVDMAMKSLDTLKITSAKAHLNRATVKFFLLEDYEFKLVKQNNRWVINEILNLSAE